MPAADDDGTIQIGVATYARPARTVVVRSLTTPPPPRSDRAEQDRRDREERERLARLAAAAAYDCNACGLESLDPRVCSHCGTSGVGAPMTLGGRR
jgi:hypothetical protein